MNERRPARSTLAGVHGRCFLLVLLAAWGAAAIGPARGRAAERTWVRVTSPSFTVVPDAGDRRAARVAWQFEQVRAVLQRLWPWARIVTGKPVMIFAARDENTMKSLAPAFWEAKGGLRPASVFVGAPDRHYVAVRADVDEPDSLHANPYFTSYWSCVYITLGASFERELPMWLGRGLSDLLANTIVRERDIQLGRVVPWHLNTLREGGRVRLPVLLAADRTSRHATREQGARDFDASAWALVHYLGFGESAANLPRLNQFLELVSKGRDVNTALVEVYGPLDRLDESVHTYVGLTMFTYTQIGLDLNVSAEGFTRRQLAPAESASDRAMFHAVMKRPADARPLAQEAAKADPALPAPAEVEGMLSDMDGNNDAARAAYSRACDLGSKNFYAYYRRAQLSWKPTLDRGDLEQIARDLDTTINLNSNWAPAYAYLAEVRLDLDDAEKALGLARRAVALEPGVASHRVSVTRSLARLSKPAEALKEAQRAMALARTPMERQRAGAMLADLKRDLK